MTAFNPSSTMMRFRRYSIELYERLGVFERVGQPAPRVVPRPAPRAGADGQPGARHRPRRRRDRRRGGPPADARDLARVALRGGPPRRRRPPRPAHGDPRGRRCGPCARGPDPDRRPRDRVRAVGPPRDPSRPDRRRTRSTRSSSSTRPGCGRRRSPRWSGAFDPLDARSTTSTSRSRPCPGSELPRDMPCFRDPDNLVYGKSEQGGMVFGGYETDPVVALGGRRAVGARGALAAARLRALRAADGRRDPALPVPRRRRGDPARLPPGRDDARRQPAARAAARASAGSGSRPGCRSTGSAVAAASAGAGRLDHDRRPGGRHRAVPGVAVRRRLPRPGVRGRARARDVLATTTGCATRTTPTSPAGRGASRRSMGGSRRPAPSSGRRPAGNGPTTTSRDGRGDAPGATRRRGAGPSRRGSIACCDEVAAVRERAGHHRPELVRQDRRRRARARWRSSSGSSANDVDRPVGSVVYTPFLDERGGMVADVTVTRLADDRFRVVTGAGFVASDLAWLRSHADDGRRGVASRRQRRRRDHRAVGAAGARRSSAAATPDDVGDAALPRDARATIHVAGGAGPRVAHQLRGRARLGADRRRRRGRSQVWDRAAVGRRATRGLEPFGYRALDALRMEKGYRYFGTDMTMLETPDEAGPRRLRPARRKGDFIGRDALEAAAGAPRDATPAGCGRSASAAPTACRSTAARRSASTATWSGDCGASPTGRPSRDDRLRLPAGRPRGGHRAPASTSSTSGCPRSIAADVLVDPPADRMRG